MQVTNKINCHSEGAKRLKNPFFKQKDSSRSALRMTFFQNNRGITLIEIMVVLAIIAMLASLVTTRVMDSLSKAKVQATRSQIKSIEQALELYKLDNDFYPTTEQGLRALIEKPDIGDVPDNYHEGGYLSKKRVPQDAWKKPFLYISDDGNRYTIISYGADKKEGGTGNSADISSDDL